MKVKINSNIMQNNYEINNVDLIDIFSIYEELIKIEIVILQNNKIKFKQIYDIDKDFVIYIDDESYNYDDIIKILPFDKEKYDLCNINLTTSFISSMNTKINNIKLRKKTTNEDTKIIMNTLSKK